MRLPPIPEEKSFSPSSLQNKQTLFGHGAKTYPYLTKPLNFETINQATKLLYPAGIHLEEDEVSHLFNQLTKCFSETINAINDKDLDTMIIRMAEASSLFFRTLYRKLENCKFIEGFAHNVRSVMKFICEQCNIENIIKSTEFDAEAITYLFSVCNYVSNKAADYLLEDQSLDKGNEGVHARYYLISHFVNELQYIPDQIIYHNEIPYDDRELKQADKDHIDNLIACHVLAEPMDQKLITELQQKLSEVELRLKNKLSIFRCLNGDIVKKIAQISLLQNVLATRPERKSFYQKLKNACDNTAVARHRNWFYRNSLAQYFFNIPQTTTVQRLNAIAKRMCENDASKDTTANAVGSQLASRAYG